MSLLTIGSVAFDAIETPYGKTDKIVGGAATYISLAASMYQTKQEIVAVVGEDFPTEMIEKLKSRGVDTTGLQIKNGEKSFFWSGKYHENMNVRDTLITELNVLENFDPIIPESYQGVEFVMLGNLSPKVQSTVIERLHKRPKFIAMDTMNFWMDIAHEDLLHTLKMVDLLIINNEEAEQLSGVKSLVKAAAIIHEMGPKYLIIKKGEHGALLFFEDEIFSAPALPLTTVKDPTGAGDSFAGGFMGYLSQQNEVTFEAMKQAIIAGSATASFCVEEFGTQRLQEITKNDVQNRLQKFIDLAIFKTNFQLA